jgi:predicted RNA-binding Zn ribbon-like protein
MVVGVPEVKHRPAGRREDALAPWLQEGTEPGVAPGTLERVRALLNTDDRFHGVDRLHGAPARLVELRDALRAHLTGGDRASLAAIAARNPLVLDLDDPSGTPRLVPAEQADPVGRAAGEVLALVHATATDGSWDRLKECGNPGCRWVFYDASRNRSGRWCSMGECGDVMKARAYRERRRTG